MVNIISRLKRFLIEASRGYFYARSSYSQEGEDLVLSRFLDVNKKGFYVEVGCHHPFRFSNTYYFYKNGWSGICVDPLPGTVEAFKKWRRLDIVREIGISDEEGFLTYYMFNEPALNTFDEKLAHERDGLRNYKIIDKKNIAVITLKDLLNKYMPTGKHDIDFLSIDVEGYDLAVLKSNDWKLFRPIVVVIECLKSDLHSMIDDPISRYMMGLDYVPYAKTGNSVIYVSAEKMALHHLSMVKNN
ncbi:FkbM family methyltransferase [bacterium]|nr:FkbM family methyltransferase [bacterium]